MTEIENLVPEWLPLPDAAERLGLDIVRVRRLLEDGELLASRVGERNILKIPAAFLTDEGVLPSLKGTAVVLSDAGFGNDEIIRWLFTPDESLPGTPIDALRAGHKTEVRRRAQALAF
ncbi:Rv2175c family DNA-binding protein [Saxibacter everestensis]|uniref:Rv2175c family DNA-binding protein n=1 Tax=Saxibacter everestensis TaxID=2909229 RepID=A0ABY8QYK9_9MICO|nr:Rv2175c family DNA-binding protein [Brevibacteriaceae bacterium ZFBP1038]